MKADTDVGHAAAEDRTDLASVQALPGVEEKDLSVSFRQSRKRRHNGLGAFMRLGGSRRICGETTGNSLLSAKRALQVEARVPSDSKQPGPRVVRNIIDAAPGD
jgi:hypothetical protein